MDEQQYHRQVQTSITVFIHHGRDYLMLKRGDHKRVDPGKLNGIGGRVEPGEDYLHAALRETEEETGYILNPDKIKLCGVVRLEGGYSEDWVMCFFKAEVADRSVPLGTKTDDGELLWLDQDVVLDSDYELVDDLYYCFKDIVSNEAVFFMNAKVNDQEKIYETMIGKISV